MITRLLQRLARRVQDRRPPDFIVGGEDRPYLLRWWLIPRNRFFNVYLHTFLRDDDDRALHDHPWCWCSILIEGSYTEHTIAAGGIERRRQRCAPSIKLSGPRRAHRIELEKYPVAKAINPQGFDMRPATTIFITGPRLRNWGFHCPKRGWVPWQEFTAANDPGAIGKGCAE